MRLTGGQVAQLFLPGVTVIQMTFSDDQMRQNFRDLPTTMTLVGSRERIMRRLRKTIVIAILSLIAQLTSASEERISGFRAVGLADGSSIELSWPAMHGADVYKLYTGNNSGRKLVVEKEVNVFINFFKALFHIDYTYVYHTSRTKNQAMRSSGYISVIWCRGGGSDKSCSRQAKISFKDVGFKPVIPQSNRYPEYSAETGVIGWSAADSVDYYLVGNLDDVEDRISAKDTQYRPSLPGVYIVRACNEYGCSAYGPVSVDDAPGYGVPTVVEGDVRYIDINQGEVYRLYWEHAELADYYLVANSSGEQWVRVNAPEVSLLVSDMGIYYVKACNIKGCSGYNIITIEGADEDPLDDPQKEPNDENIFNAFSPYDTRSIELAAEFDTGYENVPTVGSLITIHSKVPDFIHVPENSYGWHFASSDNASITVVEKSPYIVKFFVGDKNIESGNEVTVVVRYENKYLDLYGEKDLHVKNPSQHWFWDGNFYYTKPAQSGTTTDPEQDPKGVYFDWRRKWYPIHTDGIQGQSELCVRSPFYIDSSGEFPFAASATVSAADNITVGACLQDDMPEEFANNGDYPDFLPADGWEMVRQNLGYPETPSGFGHIRNGQTYPHIVLYNRFSGKLRILAHINDNMYQSMRIGISAETLPWWVSGYPDVRDVKPFLLDGKRSSSIELIARKSPSYGWVYAEADIEYDPSASYANTVLRIQFTPITRSYLTAMARGLHVSYPAGSFDDESRRDVFKFMSGLSDLDAEYEVGTFIVSEISDLKDLVTSSRSSINSTEVAAGVADVVGGIGEIADIFFKPMQGPFKAIRRFINAGNHFSKSRTGDLTGGEVIYTSSFGLSEMSITGTIETEGKSSYFGMRYPGSFPQRTESFFQNQNSTARLAYEADIGLFHSDVPYVHTYKYSQNGHAVLGTKDPYYINDGYDYLHNGMLRNILFVERPDIGWNSYSGIPPEDANIYVSLEFTCSGDERGEIFIRRFVSEQQKIGEDPDEFWSAYDRGDVLGNLPRIEDPLNVEGLDTYTDENVSTPSHESLRCDGSGKIISDEFSYDDWSVYNSSFYLGGYFNDEADVRVNVVYRISSPEGGFIDNVSGEAIHDVRVGMLKSYRSSFDFRDTAHNPYSGSEELWPADLERLSYLVMKNGYEIATGRVLADQGQGLYYGSEIYPKVNSGSN